MVSCLLFEQVIVMFVSLTLYVPRWVILDEADKLFDAGKESAIPSSTFLAQVRGVCMCPYTKFYALTHICF